MWRRLHTPLVILMLALPCFGQWTEIWTNGDLFAVNEMASQCYSASVERCQAIGIAPDEPSWWDYILGKNRAKLVSVKNNIKAVRPYFLRRVPDIADQVFSNNGISSMSFTSDVHFLSFCGLPTNSLDETPYFKTQYSAITGGWSSAYVCITNMTLARVLSSYFMTNQSSVLWSGLSSNSISGAYANLQPILTNQISGLYGSVIRARYSVPYWELIARKEFGDLNWYMNVSFPSMTNYGGETYFFSRHSYIIYQSSMKFDNQGDNIYTNYHLMTNWNRAKGEIMGPATRHDLTSVYDKPANYSELNVPGGSISRQGWYHDLTLSITDFASTTNGFKYK